MSLNPQSKEVLTQLAKDIHNNIVFTSLQVKNLNLLGNIFMPILFGALGEIDKEDIGMIYANYKDAGPMAINGYPIFWSCAFLNKADTEYVLLKIRAIEEAMKTI